MTLPEQLKSLIKLVDEPNFPCLELIQPAQACVRSISSLYSSDFAFRAIFNHLFPPGSMVLKLNQPEPCERFAIATLYARFIMSLSRRFAQTEREKTRFVETRSFLVAAIVLGFESKNIIELGGLNHPVIIALTNPSSYTSYNNKDYIERFHASHADIIDSPLTCNFSYCMQNFEDSPNNDVVNPGTTIVYSSNTFEHVQDTAGFLDSIFRLGSECVAYLCFGPIRSHSRFGHHSSYDARELFLKKNQIDCFHLLSQEAQFKIVKENAKQLHIDISDTRILEILSKSRISAFQMLNNYNYSDYHRIFHTSRLSLEKLDGLMDLSSRQKETKRRLYSEKPHIGDISTRNILAILSVDPNYFSDNYPHLTNDSDSTATHWLQHISF